MKKIISKFSDKLLSNQQLKSVKGGNYYCACGPGGLPGSSAPINTATYAECESHCSSSPFGITTVYYTPGAGSGGYWG